MSKLVLEKLKERFGDAVLATSSFRGDDVAVIAPGSWKAAARFIRDDAACDMDYFVDLSATDYPDLEDELGYRFEVYVIAYSVTKKHRVRLKVQLTGESPEVDTLSDVWKGADWQERECFDMFGVRFRGHPDLRRILMYEEFEGFPLRKDYPVNKSQPLVAYREGTYDKLGPFLADEGMPLNRSPMPDTGENR